MAAVVKLRPEEPLRLDSERLADMFVDLGEARAAHVVARIEAQVAGMLADLDNAAKEARRGDCLSLAQQIGAFARLMGLDSLSSAADGVRRAVQSGDRTAIAATAARLRRTALRSFRLTEALRHRSC